MYWRWRSIPELADLSEMHRTRLWEEARADPFRPSDLLWLVLMIGVVVVATIPSMLLPQTLPWWSSAAMFLVTMFAASAFLQVVLIYRYRPVVRRLRGLN